MAGKQNAHSGPRVTHRILYVSDPSSIARTVLPDPVNGDDLRRWVDMLADSGIDTFDQEVFSQGWTVYWRSDRYEYDQRPQHRRFLPMIEGGTMPLDILIDQSHRRGMRFVAGFRINDGHAGHNRRAGIGIAEYIESHPHLRLHDPREGQGFEEPEALDFTFDEVRDFTFGVIEEVAQRFAIDGVELCFRDTAYFPPDQAPERAPLMTRLVRRVREMLDQRSAQTGGKPILGARVYASIGECARQGLDVPAWIRDGLLDYVSPQDTMYADFNVPYAEWSALTTETDCMMYPGLNPWTSYRARYRLGRIPLRHANARALAHTMYRAGADGLSVYNHHIWAWQPPFYPQAMQVFHQLGDPERVARGERHYVFDPTWAGNTVFGADGRAGTGAIKAQQLRLDRDQLGATGEFCFQLYEDLREAVGATLLFRGFGMTEDDELEVRLNGQLITDDSINRTASSDRATTVDSTRRLAGRMVPCIAEGGRIDFRANAENPPPAFATRWFSLAPDMLLSGQNCLSITLVENDPDADSPAIVIDEVEIYVEPR
jgi:hypothetical protein